jgi:1-aminocyclopropane-1-carboxylate deaminase/D-cysteine desulfhydrase-like pyridoxal-dependent ACC family enzyme
MQRLPNHAVVTAAAAKKLGLDIILVLRGKSGAIPKGELSTK